MNFTNLSFLVCLALVLSISINDNAFVDAHAYLIEPPSRSSAWTIDPDFQECCVNYNHNQMFCGGFPVQWEQNGGRCGICGDSWSQPEPRDYEKGGAKYLGKIVRAYKKNVLIPISVIITANHMGFFEFRICNVDEFEGDATQECLNETLLTIDQTSNTKYIVENTTRVANYSLKLPADFACDHCVLQWKYVAGNGWGVDPDTGRGCVGCGPVQENFMGCADIAIGDDVELPSTTRATTTSTTTTTAASTTAASSSTTTTASTTTSSTAPSTTATTTTTTTTTSRTNPTTTATTSTSQPTTATSTNPTTTHSYVVSAESEEEKGYGECGANLPFGNVLDISNLVKIYCYRMCKVSCPDIMKNVTSSFQNRMACSRTCPILCDC